MLFSHLVTQPFSEIKCAVTKSNISCDNEKSEKVTLKYSN